MRLKKYILIIFLFALSVSGMGQQRKPINLTTFDFKRFHLGFTVGLNMMDFSLEHWSPIGSNPDFADHEDNSADYGVYANDTIRADVSSLNPGITVGLVSSYRLGDFCELRFLPGLALGERRLVYNVPVYDEYSENTDAQSYYSIKTTYLELPLVVKYKARRQNNQCPYLIGGGSLKFDLSKTDKEDLVQLKRAGFYLEAGVGWDSYLSFFRLSTELRVSLGLNNLLDSGPDSTQRQYYTDAIKKLKSNLFTLSFHFE